MVSGNGSGNQRVIRMGVIGIGGGATAMIPIFHNHPGFKWTAAADLDTNILEAFRKDYEVETFTDAEKMCESPNVDAVYIATPNRWHMPHALMALNNKKHVLSEKPMTISIDEATQMIDAADKNGVHLAVNVKHSFEQRVLKLREFVANKTYGELRLINWWFYNDWLYRPRTPEELTPEWGGGVPWRQGPHQMDIIRTVAGGRVRSLKGMTQAWNPVRRVPGIHAAYLDFEDGATAMAMYSGNDHMSSQPIVRGMGEQGPLVNERRYAQARKEFRDNPEAEALAAAGERYGGARRDNQPDREASAVGTEARRANTGGWMSGGPMVVSFDHADIWVQPDGLLVCDDEKQTEIKTPAPYGDGRWGRVATFYESLIKDEAPPADGRWGRATIEVILSIFESSEQRKEVFLKHQTPTADASLGPARV